MAEGTRLKDLSEHMTTLDTEMQKLTLDYQEKVKELAAQIKEVSEVEQSHFAAAQAESARMHEYMLKDSALKHEEVLRLIASQSTSTFPAATSRATCTIQRDPQCKEEYKGIHIGTREVKGKGLLPIPVKGWDAEDDERRTRGNNKYHNHQYAPYPKSEFPTFGGEDPRSWVENCEHYYEIYQIPQQQWLSIASMHLTGKARIWRQSYFIQEHDVSWEEFTEALYRRFAQTGERYLVRELNNLKQTSTVERYQEQFEELRNRLLFYNSHLTEEHLISCYINGLKEDLIPFIDIAHPNTLLEAYEQATLHEKALTVINRKFKGNVRTPNGLYQSPLYPRQAPGPPGPKVWQNNPQGTTGTQLPNNKALIEQRRAAGQCFKCGERYHPGHVCSTKTLNYLQGIDDILETYDENYLQEDPTEEGMEEQEEISNAPEIGVSIHALSGEKQPNTIKVQGEVKGQALSILVDTGSTHSFLDYQTAKDIKAIITAAAPLMVTVTNGQKVLSKLQCAKFQWAMQGHTFHTDLRVIRLGGSSMVLGIDWLRSHSRVTFDFHQESITIQKDGHPLVLSDIKEGAQLKIITANQWYQDFQQGECCLISH